MIMSLRQELMIPKNITDLIADRDLIILNFKNMESFRAKAEQICKESGPYVYPVQSFRNYGGIDSIKKDVDKRMWRRVIELTGFNKYMDKTARKEFDESLDKSPPEFNINNVRSTLVSSYNQSDMFMRRGIVNLFRNLGANYKSNSSFKVNKKIILQNWFSNSFGYFCINYHAEPEMNDLDRVIRTMDGKDFKEHVFSGEMRKVASKMYFENEYFKIKAFKNGNAHMWLKRDDLTDKINDIIAEWYDGNSLG